MWWDETIAHWKQQGLPAELESVFDIADYFGLDPYQQFWFSTTDDTIEAVQHHVEGIVSNIDDYLRLRPQCCCSRPVPMLRMIGRDPQHGTRAAENRKRGDRERRETCTE